MTAKTKSTKTQKQEAAKATSKGKTELVLKMVEQGKTRKQILDKLCEMDDSIPRKSNAGLVSHIFKKNELLGKVESGVERGKKKEVKILPKKSKKASGAKASK